jgi:hypothetical protein
MSLVALKRNARRRKAPISGRPGGGFSLNGGRRNQGWVGQTTAPRRACSANDPSIIKRSTMNTAGLIDATVTHPTGAMLESTRACDASCKINWVKDTSAFATSSAEHTRALSTRTATKNPAWSWGLPVKERPGCGRGCGAASFWIGGKHYVREPYAKGAQLHSTSSSEYQATGLMRKKSLPTPPCLSHFPFTMNYNSTLQTRFMTPAQAIASGALPPDWMKCTKHPNCCYPCDKVQARSVVVDAVSYAVGQPPTYTLLYSNGLDTTNWDGVHAQMPDTGELVDGQTGLAVGCGRLRYWSLGGTQPATAPDVIPLQTTAYIEFEPGLEIPTKLNASVSFAGGHAPIHLGEGLLWPPPPMCPSDGFGPCDAQFVGNTGKPGRVYYWNTSSLAITGLQDPMPDAEQSALDALLAPRSGQRLTIHLSRA